MIYHHEINRTSNPAKDFVSYDMSRREKWDLPEGLQGVVEMIALVGWINGELQHISIFRSAEELVEYIRTSSGLERRGFSKLTVYENGIASWNKTTDHPFPLIFEAKDISERLEGRPLQEWLKRG
jgi:hypothetical protein